MSTQPLRKLQSELLASYDTDRTNQVRNLEIDQIAAEFEQLEQQVRLLQEPAIIAPKSPTKGAIKPDT